MTTVDTAPRTAARRPLPGARGQTLRLWRDGALTFAAFGLVAALVFGTLPTTRHDVPPALLADAALAR